MRHVVGIPKVILVTLVSSFIGITAGSSARATTMTLEATSKLPTIVSDFSITFNDTGNGLLDFSEITSFSGMTDFNIHVLWPEVFQLPSISGFVVGNSPISGCAPLEWCFGINTPGESNGVGLWTYSLSATPLPAALPLFASGLGALGLLGWRRKRKAAALAT
jgi:hypothetical protein